jgi:hypothetical protein
MTNPQRIGIKLLLVLAATVAIASYDSDKTNLGPVGAVVIAIVFFVALSAWLHFMRRLGDSQIDTSISIAGPFWPMKRHPFQYWSLVSVALILGGLSSILKVVVLEHGKLALGATFLLLGIATGLAVLTQSRR